MRAAIAGSILGASTVALWPEDLRASFKTRIGAGPAAEQPQRVLADDLLPRGTARRPFGAPRSASPTPEERVSGLTGAHAADRPPDALRTQDPGLATDLDALFSSGILSPALVGVRIDSLSDGRTLYSRNDNSLVMPASNMKILTMAIAADRLGWDARFETTLEAAGPIADGILQGDLIVTGTGDPSIAAQDLRSPALFVDWADALRAAGIRRVEGRLIGDDNAFDDEPIGAGWAWDYLAAGYAAPSGALSYNENVAVLTIAPGTGPNALARVNIGPPGHGLELVNEVRTGESGSPATIALARLPGSARLTVSGRVPLGSAPVVRTTAIDNPTQYFVKALRTTLAERGIVVTGEAADIDDIKTPIAAGSRRLIASRSSEPLSGLVGYAMKVSQNFYGEMILKALGRSAGKPGSTEAGRQVVRETLSRWGLTPDALVMYDGSGLSRYNYVTADLVVGVLTHVWRDDRLRGPFAASLPVGGRDGTLQSRLSTPTLDRRVQAKTGTINNVRALSGYVETASGERLAFSMIANNFTAPVAQVDAVMDRALERLIRP